jgi:hypothetical protein
MSVSGILVGSNANFPRSYISGFVGSAGVTNMVYSGGFLHFDYLAPVITVDLKIRPNFFAPSSNCYSLDYVFDFAASQVYLNGSPIAAGVGYKFVAMVSEPTWRIQVLATLAIDETQRLDLFPLAHYWRPLG